MKTYAAMFCAMLAMGALTVSCSSEDEAVQGATEGEGLISFDVKTETGFQSRAVNEADYANINNYTVQLLKDGEVQNEWKKSLLPVTTKVDAGTYQLKAFYGEDKAASTTSMYVEGIGEEVEVTANQEEPAKLSVVCKPVCAKFWWSSMLKHWILILAIIRLSSKPRHWAATHLHGRKMILTLFI